ncbi:uncharacterized protein METZ01_LOCUS137520 [marine metagenome]|uniref:R3H domain-containing protein n=1 Tax=marine metagenome TaxID=408172 RepID=A0A381Z5V3_9ZZZZ
MEWIETTGASVDEAKERALDRLGVAEDDLEYQVLAEPTSALFGLRRTDARLRARVRPVSPRSKEERRDRGHRRGQKRASDRAGGARRGKSGGSRRDSDRDAGRGSDDKAGSTNKRKSRDGGRSEGKTQQRRGVDGGGSKERSGRLSTKETGKRDTSHTDREDTQESPKGTGSDDNGDTADLQGMEVKMMDLETQAQVTEDFVRGLLEHMGLEARVVSSIDEDRALVEAQGLNLGLAIGQRGDTVRAITQLARTMVQRMSDGNAEGSLVVDVGGYRERRRSFLTEFADTQAEEVLADGRSRALEPMNAADRKVLHDAVAEIDGVTTQSEGSDMERHVVILIESEG